MNIFHGIMILATCKKGIEYSRAGSGIYEVVRDCHIGSINLSTTPTFISRRSFVPVQTIDRGYGLLFALMSRY